MQSVSPVSGSLWCRGLAIFAWLVSLAAFYVGFVLSWGFGLAGMLYWSVVALPTAWLTVRWLRRLGAPWTARERAWIRTPWLILLLIQVPLWFAPDHPVWDGREWLLAYPDLACRVFPFAVVGWAVLRIVRAPSWTKPSLDAV